jgi:WD40 repeat protein
LEKRGLTLTGITLLALLNENAATAAFPARLLIPAVTAARAFALGKILSATDRAVMLANKILKTAAIRDLVKTGLTFLLVAIGVSGSAIVAGSSWLGESRQGESTVSTIQPDLQEQRSSHVDLQGVPLPPEAISRLGSMPMTSGGNIRWSQAASYGYTAISDMFANSSRWDLTTGKKLKTIVPDERKLLLAGPPPTISPDGQLEVRIVESSIEVCDVKTGTKMARFGTALHEKAISPDSKLVVALGEKGPELYEISTGKMLWKADRYTHYLASVCFASDGKSIAIADWVLQQNPPSSNNTIRILEVSSGKEQQVIDLGIYQPTAIHFSPDNSLVITICVVRHPTKPPEKSGKLDEKSVKSESQLARREIDFVSELRVWDFRTGKEKLRLQPPWPESKRIGCKYFGSVIFAPDNKSLIGLGSGDDFVQWDLATGKIQRRFGHGLEETNALSISPDRKLLVTGKGQMTQIEFHLGRDLLSPTGKSPRVSAVAFSKEGDMLLTAGSMNDAGQTRITYWEASTGKELRQTKSLEGFVRGFTRDGAALLQTNLVFADLCLRHLAVRKSRNLVTDLRGGWAAPCALTASGKQVAVFDSGTRTITVFDTETGSMIRRWTDREKKVSHLRFAGDEQRLFVFDEDQTVTIYNLADGNQVGQFVPTKVPHKRPVPGTPPEETPVDPPFEVALSPDGKTIASLDFAEYILLYDAADGRNVRRIDTGKEIPWLLTFTPDNKFLLWSNISSPDVHVIDVAKGKEVRKLKGHRGAVTSYAFSPDGQRLATGNTDGTALVWDLAKIEKSLR